MVGHLIVDDIRSQPYDLKNYKAPSSFLDSAHEQLPASLKKLLDVIIKSKKKLQKIEILQSEITE